MAENTENYFQILNVPTKLQMDQGILKKNYFNLLKENKRDPILDKGTNEADDKKMIALIEEAYNTLKDRISRIEHLLQIEGLDVANDNKAPRNFRDIDEQVKDLLPKFNQNPDKYRTELKELHANVLSEFSAASIELSRLEKQWDELSKNDEADDLLRKLRRKSAAFNYIRNVEQDIRQNIA
ncbi:MAG: hypothetical protein H7A33_08305 [Deltaproteobacteria bacterium]|nr:hypothetical protein [Deltaproteobacteria bacterium]